MGEYFRANCISGEIAGAAAGVGLALVFAVALVALAGFVVPAWTDATKISASAHIIRERLRGTRLAIDRKLLALLGHVLAHAFDHLLVGRRIEHVADPVRQCD